MCEKAPELISSRDLLAIENKEMLYEGYVNESYKISVQEGMSNMAMQ
jgi:hypothetical protein